MIRHLASAEFGAGILFNSIDPRDAAAQLRRSGETERAY
jgi:hypothetical protein